MPGFDVDAARKAGYSDDEILAHLTQTRKFDVDGALKAGYSKQDIIGHLSSTSAPTDVQTQAPQQKPSFWQNPNAYLQNRIGELEQEAQRQHNLAMGPESQGKSFLSRSGHSLAALIPETAQIVDKTVLGMNQWKNVPVIAAGAVDPAIPAAYFMTQGAQGTAEGTKKIVSGQATPSDVQDTFMSASMVAGSPAVSSSPRAGRAAEYAKNVPSPRGVMAKRMAEVPPGEQFSRGEVLDAAQQHGVNLDVAQATDSGTAGALKKANRYSLASQGVYDANTTKNVGALQQWADGELNRYSPVSAEREVVGGQLQQQLRSHLEARKNLATNTFKELDGDVGSNTIDATGTIEAEARKIVSDNKEYYAKHPELKPTKAWNILENLAERPKVNTVNPKATAPGLMDVNGQPVSATGTITKQPAQAHTFTWSELHQLRSDLMDFYRNNPDVVKGRSEAWIQQMVANIDNAMTDASAGLSGEQLAKFRQANQVWESIKNTYDNPQSPYYHAVRAQYASQVPGMLSKATPELARQVRDTLGNLEGPFQRQFVENLISDKSGNLDLGKLDMKLSRIPNDHLVAMIGEDGARQLKLLGKVAKKVGYDLNPSGTAKVGVPATEIGGLLNPSTTLPTAGELFLQRLGAKAMNSPSLVNFLTKARP